MNLSELRRVENEAGFFSGIRVGKGTAGRDGEMGQVFLSFFVKGVIYTYGKSLFIKV